METCHPSARCNLNVPGVLDKCKANTQSSTCLSVSQAPRTDFLVQYPLSLPPNDCAIFTIVDYLAKNPLVHWIFHSRLGLVIVKKLCGDYVHIWEVDAEKADVLPLSPDLSDACLFFPYTPRLVVHLSQLE